MQVMSSNLDKILHGHKTMKDAYVESQAEIYKAVLRNILLIKQVRRYEGNQTSILSEIGLLFRG